jgi:hypothetical protein
MAGMTGMAGMAGVAELLLSPNYCCRRTTIVAELLLCLALLLRIFLLSSPVVSRVSLTRLDAVVPSCVQVLSSIIILLL